MINGRFNCKEGVDLNVIKNKKNALKKLDLMLVHITKLNKMSR